MGPYVHQKLTQRWALEEGVLEHDAEMLARSDAEFDKLFPGKLIPFWPLHLGPMAWVIGRFRLEVAIRIRSPKLAGWGLHGVQDYFAHGWLGEKHLLLRLGLRKVSPDEWDLAPAGVRRRIERSTRSGLRRYAARY